MNDLFRIATAELVRFLSRHPSDLSDDRWKKHVVDRLSFHAIDGNGAECSTTLPLDDVQELV